MYTQIKNALRNKIRDEIAGLSQDYCETADTQIMKNVIQLKEFQSADTVFCYVGRADEINTMPLLRYILDNGKKLGVPKCISKGIMEVYEIKSLKDLQPGAYGIMEPNLECRHINPDEIQFVCVPCMSCSLDGRRLGYGGGFYDRYLKKVQCSKCVLCRSAVMTERVPIAEHDIKMDIVVTEKEVIYQ